VSSSVVMVMVMDFHLTARVWSPHDLSELFVMLVRASDQSCTFASEKFFVAGFLD